MNLLLYVGLFAGLLGLFTIVGGLGLLFGREAS